MFCRITTDISRNSLLHLCICASDADCFCTDAAGFLQVGQPPSKMLCECHNVPTEINGLVLDAYRYLQFLGVMPCSALKQYEIWTIFLGHTVLYGLLKSIRDGLSRVTFGMFYQFSWRRSSSAFPAPKKGSLPPPQFEISKNTSVGSNQMFRGV